MEKLAQRQQKEDEAVKEELDEEAAEILQNGYEDEEMEEVIQKQQSEDDGVKEKLNGEAAEIRRYAEKMKSEWRRRLSR